MEIYTMNYVLAVADLGNFSLVPARHWDSQLCPSRLPNWKESWASPCFTAIHGRDSDRGG